jgi:hypothetical protein
VREKIPEQYSSPEAVQIIKRLGAVSDLGIGQIGYRIKQKPDIQNVINITDLIDSSAFTPDFESVENLILAGSK